ncbi:fructose-1,6-bisphosphatase [Dehalococcoidia bacterium]|nr:fructose-1,6-bisphosphatase [Dehalococcoidia bacterium]
MNEYRETLGEFVSLNFAGNALYDGLGDVLLALSRGAYKVHEQVQAAALADILGSTGESNVHGEIVQRLDEASSKIFVDVLIDSGYVALIGCEEIEKPVIAQSSQEKPYMVLMDPLDGSSNIDVAVSIGSIFGIWRKDAGETAVEDSPLRPGSQQVAAAYIVYGSSTIMVVATSKQVNGFTLDSQTGTFILTHKDIRIPSECPYYSTNEGNFKVLDKPTQTAISSLRSSLSLRYVGSLVADFHRNLLKGGIFLYPADASRPQGRLRLMYEANPLGYVAEQAGGAASTGRHRILDIQPAELHEKTPLIIGNRGAVEQVVSVINDG